MFVSETGFLLKANYNERLDEVWYKREILQLQAFFKNAQLLFFHYFILIEPKVLIKKVLFGTNFVACKQVKNFAPTRLAKQEV